MLEWFREPNAFQAAMNGLLAAATAIGVIFGLSRKATKDEASQPSKVEVAGALLKTDIVDALAEQTGLNTSALSRLKTVLEANTRASESLCRQIEKLERSICELKDENESLKLQVLELRTEARIHNQRRD